MPYDSHWYELPDYEKHQRVFEHVRGIEHVQGDVHEANLCHARLYANREEPGLRSGSRSTWRDGWQGVTENIVQQAIDSATNLIAKSRPKVTVLTDGADWEMQQTARRLDKYVFGMFRALGIHQLMVDVFRDSCIFGTGVLHLFEKDGDIKAERVLIDEIVVDEAQVPSGEMPQEIHRVKLVSRVMLCKMFPDAELEIEQAGQGDRVINQFRLNEPNMVLVIESWRLNKRHTICIDNKTLLDEPYDKDWYPMVFHRFNRPITGFYGQGIAERLLGFQIRLNDMNDFIQKCQDLIAVPTVVMEATGKALPVITNEIGRVLQYVGGGKAPVFHTPEALRPEYYNYKETLKQAALQELGISQQMAHAAPAPGVEAAVAMREATDTQSQRFSTQHQFFEDTHLEVGRKIIDLARGMYRRKGKAPTVYLAERFVETIDWPKADFEKNRFVLQVQASSILSNTPAGRLQQVIELSQYNVPLTPAETRKLLAHPDLEQADRYATSTLDDIEWLIGKLSNGEYYAPEAFQDLALGLELVTAAYLDARRLGAPESILQLFRDWVGAADKEMKKGSQAQAAMAAAQAPPMDPMMAGMDPAMGMAPPGAMPPVPMQPPM